MNHKVFAQDALNLLRDLEKILNEEGGQNWLRGIEATRLVGEQFVGIEDDVKALVEMSSIYRGMHSGPSGFDDFFIWRESAADRVAANQELNRIKDELWEILGTPLSY